MIVVLSYKQAKPINPHNIMKKEAEHVHPIKLDKAEGSWEDIPAIQWLSQYGTTLLIAVLGAIALVFIAYRISTIGTESEEASFWNADKEFLQFVNPETMASDPLAGEDALAKLKKIIDSNPELHAKYDALIAQTLINRDEAGDAMPFANPAIKRTEAENSPYYADYSQTTLLISDGKYDEALKKALALDKQMRDALAQNKTPAERQFGDMLFAFNVLRIGTLQRQLNLKADELKTWQDWKQFLQGTQYPAMAKAFQQQRIIYSEGKTSLSDYIDMREKALKDKRT